MNKHIRRFQSMAALFLWVATVGAHAQLLRAPTPVLGKAASAPSSASSAPAATKRAQLATTPALIRPANLTLTQGKTPAALSTTTPQNATPAGTAVPPAPPPPPAQGAAPGVPVVGYELVFGPSVTVAPLSDATTSAQCPAGKVAFAAGVEASAPGDATFGLEVRGAWPVDQLATVRLRNANIAVSAQLRAQAICAVAPAGLRAFYFDAGVPATHDPATVRVGSCGPTESLVGGGVMGRIDTVISSNGPQSPGSGRAHWQAASTRASPVSLPGTVGIEARALCAARASVDGWSFVESAPVELGARSQSSLTLTCPPGKVVLGAGVVQLSGNGLDLVTSAVLVRPDGTASAHVHNRNTLGSAGAVRALLSAVCARQS